MEKILVHRAAHCKRYWVKEEQLTWQAYNNLELFLDAIVKQHDTVLRHLATRKECRNTNVRDVPVYQCDRCPPEKVAEVTWKLYLFKSLRHVETLPLHFPVQIAHRAAAVLPTKSPYPSGNRFYLATWRVQLQVMPCATSLYQNTDSIFVRFDTDLCIYHSRVFMCYKRA